MPRGAVPLVAGGYYHVYNRGNNRQRIFFDRWNYLFFLRRVRACLIGEGLVDRAEDWEFSSYRDYISPRQGTLPLTDVFLSQFATSDDYRRFVESYQSSDKLVISHWLYDED